MSVLSGELLMCCDDSSVGRLFLLGQHLNKRSESQEQNDTEAVHDVSSLTPIDDQSHTVDP